MVSSGIHAPPKMPDAQIIIEVMPDADLSPNAVPIITPKNMHIIKFGNDDSIKSKTLPKLK
jgi:hypothetical protein